MNIKISLIVQVVMFHSIITYNFKYYIVENNEVRITI